MIVKDRQFKSVKHLNDNSGQLKMVTDAVDVLFSTMRLVYSTGKLASLQRIKIVIAHKAGDNELISGMH